MNRTKIEWCDSTWNPVTGCYHKCEYCYARRVATRFGTKLPDRSGYPEVYSGVHCLEHKIKDNPYPYIFEPTFLPFRLKEPELKTKPRTIFVCSMADLFGSWVPDEWIEEVFAACARAPQHRYLFLTKNPQRYIDLAEAGKLPKRDNMWYGTTVTAPMEQFFWATAYHTFVSIEPILQDFTGQIETDRGDFPQWIIIGAETGNRKDKVIPEKSWIDAIIKASADKNISLFMKNSLIPIVGEENMFRELPWDVRTWQTGREKWLDGKIYDYVG